VDKIQNALGITRADWLQRRHSPLCTEPMTAMAIDRFTIQQFPSSLLAECPSRGTGSYEDGEE